MLEWGILAIVVIYHKATMRLSPMTVVTDPCLTEYTSCEPKRLMEIIMLANVRPDSKSCVPI